ncbi:MAG: ribosome maturation factor RimP [Methylotenera sp.]|nr:ribosome maturation factor RimP [Oligoflexia bacterium]
MTAAKKMAQAQKTAQADPLAASLETTVATSVADTLNAKIAAIIAPFGYELVYVELINNRQRLIRVYIDHVDAHLGPDADRGYGDLGIGVEDCAKVSRALDEPLDLMPEMETIFSGTYELEVSSPGIDRPLRLTKDFERFKGREARVHVFRPLTAEEMGNPQYQQKNPKQKNFIGVLKGVRSGAQGESVILVIDPSQGSLKHVLGSSKKQAGKKSPKIAKAPSLGAEAPTNSAEVKTEDGRDIVLIPLPLISKANLEPDFGILDSKELS